ncbi:unnamed protein product [Polarella glacialis]|uniref:Steroid 5-alpha reductase C-terminal domain-containing protein n=1 Tax=Polarella glacialis TaxID=89957 RepID=A0A813HVD0_POLGL|nr:unnamed protein product [Polarella glacialis]
MVLGAAVQLWPATSWPVTFVACSGGFSNILYTFGVGYGVSMTANAGLTVAMARYRGVPLTPFGLACCGLYAAYGVRLTTFLLRRQSDESYAKKFHEVQLKTDNMGLGTRFALVFGVSLSQALYALPLTVATSPAIVTARPALKALGWAGVGVAALGLVVEHLADEQKLAAKQRDNRAPVMDGLYSYSKHPNYLGEMLFHCGVCCFAVSGTPLQLIACSAAPLFMASVMVNSARRLDREGDHKHAQADGYKEWAENTPTLMPRFW